MSRLLRRDVASNGPLWLPPVLVLGATAAVAYADHLATSISLAYLYAGVALAKISAALLARSCADAPSFELMNGRLIPLRPPPSRYANALTAIQFSGLVLGVRFP